MSAEVVLYSRPGCHLCDEARDLLESLRDRRRRSSVREVDIETDDRLLAALPRAHPGGRAGGEISASSILDPDAVRGQAEYLGRVNPDTTQPEAEIAAAEESGTEERCRSALRRASPATSRS